MSFNVEYERQNILWSHATSCGLFLPIFVISGILKFVNLLNVSLQILQKNHKKQNSEPLYGLEIRIAYFESLDSPTLISRKILVTRKIL